MKVIFAAVAVFLVSAMALSAHHMANAQQETAEEFSFANDLNFEKTLESCTPESGPQKNFISPNNPLITSQAILLMDNGQNDFEKLKSAFEFVSKDIDYKVYNSWRYPDEVLAAKSGDCTDKSVLLVSMLENYEIESYVITGKKVNDYSHAWVAAKIDNKWLQIDPTAGDLNFVYDCLADENCTYHNNYEIESVFNEREVLKCGN